MADYDLLKILPQKPPMRIINDIANVDMEKRTLETYFIPNRNMIFADDKGVNSISAIEFMAQSIGCYAYFKNGGKEPVLGMLLGSRLVNIKNEYFEFDKKYTVKVSEVFSDGEIVVFDCLIYDENTEELASATINVYQGEKMKELAKSGK